MEISTKTHLLELSIMIHVSVGYSDLWGLLLSSIVTFGAVTVEYSDLWGQLLSSIVTVGGRLCRV